MYFKKVLAFVLCSVVVIQGAFVDTLSKCGKDDGECGAKLIQKVLKDIAKTGVPELDIPAIDPVELKDVKVKILNDVHIHLIEGTVKGVKNCKINSFSPNTDKFVATLDLTCDLSIKGRYKLSAESDLVKSLLGGEVKGDGTGKVKIVKINIKVSLPYDLVIRDGDVFIQAKKDKLDYSFDIQGSVVFAADNLVVAGKESSAEIVKMMNDNWKSVIGFIDKKLIDEVAVETVFGFLEKFLNNVATKYYVIEDLTPLAKS